MALTKVDDRGLKTPIDLLDNEKIRFGTGNDLEIYHDGTNNRLDFNTGSYNIFEGGNFIFRNVAGNEDYAKFLGDGAVELWYNGVKKFETTSYGNLSAAQVRVSSSNASTVAFSCGDVGTGFYNTGSNAIGYSANGTQKWNIDSAGNLRFVDSVKANFGTGDDLRIYHDGTYTWMTDASTGGWHSKASKFVWQTYDNAENMAIFHEDGAVRLWYDGSEKFATSSAGVTVTGDLTFADSAAHDIILQGGKIYGETAATGALTIQSTNGNSNHAAIIVGENYGSDNGGITFYGAGSSTADVKMRIRGNTDNIEIPDKFQGKNGLFNYLEENTEATNYFYKMFKETLA